jgi:hypothetical protein
VLTRPNTLYALPLRSRNHRPARVLAGPSVPGALRPAVLRCGVLGAHVQETWAEDRRSGEWRGWDWGRHRMCVCVMCVPHVCVMPLTLPPCPPCPSPPQALLVRDEEFALRAAQEVQLCQECDRVALLLWLTQKATGQHVVIANTHLTFPHSEADRKLQLRQVCMYACAVDNSLVSAEKTRHRCFWSIS